jgi:glyoxylase-like metal-dependent hydrolase (beta-lactamase superfamily II)
MWNIENHVASDFDIQTTEEATTFSVDIVATPVNGESYKDNSGKRRYVKSLRKAVRRADFAVIGGHGGEEIMEKLRARGFKTGTENVPEQFEWEREWTVPVVAVETWEDLAMDLSHSSGEMYEVVKEIRRFECAASEFGTCWNCGNPCRDQH